MPKIIEAIYENGVFKPTEHIDLPESYKIKIIIPEIDNADQYLKESLEKGYHMGKILSDIDRENIYNDIG
ncbi:MAG: antitoxin family protein [Nitrospirae bacterium]|nr:antitoxin family protein [Nitrospirota bacterium]